MKVEIWFDFTCPFSYRGIRNFNQALELFTNNKDVKVFLNSYNINPDITKSLDVDAFEYLANHNDISYQEAQNKYLKIANRLKEEGLNLNFNNLIPTTGLKAHNILKLIDDDFAKMTFICYVFSAHFEEGKDISSLDVLTEIGKNVDLNHEDIKAVYETEMYEAVVNHDFLKAEEYGLTGVPAFVVDDSYYLLGGHSKEAYLEMLETFYRKQRKHKNETNTFCEGETCWKNVKR